MKKFIISVFILFSMSAIYADELAKNRLIDLLENSDTMVASFEQSTFGADESLSSLTTGKLYISSDLRFAWLIEEPYIQEMISDGSILWVYEPDLEQATYQSIEQTLRQSPAMLLVQPRIALSQGYDVTMAESGSLTTFTLYPDGEDTVFEQLTMSFVDNRIDRLEFRDNLGQRTVVDLSDIEVNVQIDDNRFEFVPPPGVDVFEQL